MAKTYLKLLAPATKKRAVGPLRRPNSELRSREHLTEAEVEKLIEATKAIGMAIVTRQWSWWLGAEGFLERKDLQRLLRTQIQALAPDLMVICEEFGQWVDKSLIFDDNCTACFDNLNLKFLIYP
jgi:hypothetical protein